MRVLRSAAALLLAGALTMPLAGAAGKQFSDLPDSHWAHDSMMQAVELGIIQGTGGDTVAPAMTLTWGQYLTMLARAFAPDAYAAAQQAGQAWDVAGYTAAEQTGLLEGLSVTQDVLGTAITRQDAAVLLCNALPEDPALNNYASYIGTPMDASTLNDWGMMDEVHQQALARLAQLGVVQGRGDGSFGWADSIQRCDGTTLLMRVLTLTDLLRSGESMEITLRWVDSTTGQSILPDSTTTAYVGQYLPGLGWDAEVGYYNYDYDASPLEQVSSACTTYTLYYQPMSQAQIQEEQFWEKVERGEASMDDYWLQDFWLTELGENDRKHLLLFGDASKRRFANQEEAAAAMTSVTVPVWKLSNGQKVSSTLTFSVHSALAEDVKAIFTEIYNDPEQFPIYELGGYSWRGDSATGEHNCGTAIDINANENYQVRDGQAMVGSCWEPGSNPYSIAPESSVVRIFEAHGWSWGGDAWAYDSDASTGYHDYMHFSYMGM